jgi:hypothetical protein
MPSPPGDFGELGHRGSHDSPPLEVLTRLELTGKTGRAEAPDVAANPVMKDQPALAHKP